MTFSEDSATPAAPFSGDGSIFDQDVLSAAPTTSERIVDTQSGFLLVVKRMGERLALSCKRRVGTPPSSAILLTPDESLKFSKILSAATIGLDEPESTLSSQLSWVGRKGFPFGSATKPAQRPTFVDSLKNVALVFGVIVLTGAGFAIGLQTQKVWMTKAATTQSIALQEAKVDTFARTFVSQMLDFNPATYKASQVQAMSSMSPELLEKYWQETSFPLSNSQLKALPQDTTIMIESIKQERMSPLLTSCDIFAQLLKPDTKVTTPVHIRLKLSQKADGSITVLEQEDVTSR